MALTDGPRRQGGGLTTGEVARRLGVAPTTVRSWDRRYGLGPRHHAGGRHRRWTPADLATLERMCALTSTGLPPSEAARLAREQAAPDAERAPQRSPARAPGAGSGLRPEDVRRTCRGLARAALRLDPGALDELLATVIADHGLMAAWTEVIMPTMQAVGRKWENTGEKYAEVEHLLSWHVVGALRRSAPPVPAGPSDATTLLACVPGERHTLPLEVLASALAQRGMPIRMFGAALPAEALVEAVHRTGPAAVGLWAQSRTTASRPLARHVAAMEWGMRGARTRPVVLTLGPGWAGRTVPGLRHPSGLAEAVTALSAVVEASGGAPVAAGRAPRGQPLAGPRPLPNRCCARLEPMGTRVGGYRYVGPAELKAAVTPGSGGVRIGSAAGFDSWMARRTAAETAEPFTFVVGTDGLLRLAARRSEHVVCAGGEPVLGAGEIGFAREGGRWLVSEISNQSTGYCPDVSSWPAVARALERAGLEGPNRFTHEVVFRRCPACQEHNIVREGDFVCVFCDSALPEAWNVDPG